MIEEPVLFLPLGGNPFEFPVGVIASNYALSLFKYLQDWLTQILSRPAQRAPRRAANASGFARSFANPLCSSC